MQEGVEVVIDGVKEVVASVLRVSKEEVVSTFSLCELSDWDFTIVISDLERKFSIAISDAMRQKMTTVHRAAHTIAAKFRR